MARQLLIIADDFGIGPETSRGILELAQRGLVTGSVLLVNSPFAEAAVKAWRQAGQPLELGWHPNLTLDRPVLAADRVPSLVGPDGCFRPLAAFLPRLIKGSIRVAEIQAELLAQHQRFGQLVGHDPFFVNAHHHLNIFGPVGSILLSILGSRHPLPYVRRVLEPWTTIRKIAGARGKRLMLSNLGRSQAAEQARRGFPGNDWLAGTNNPACVKDPQFYRRWLETVPGNVVELMCHPGHPDRTLIGRDCQENDGFIQWRADEWQLLSDPALTGVMRRQGWELTAPRQLLRASPGGAHAA